MNNDIDIYQNTGNFPTFHKLLLFLRRQKNKIFTFLSGVLIAPELLLLADGVLGFINHSILGFATLSGVAFLYFSPLLLILMIIGFILAILGQSRLLKWFHGILFILALLIFISSIYHPHPANFSYPSRSLLPGL